MKFSMLNGNHMDAHVINCSVSSRVFLTYGPALS